MNKKLKKYLSIYLSIFVLIFNIFIIPVNAADHGGGGGYFTTDSFSFANSGLSIGQYDFGYYYMENDSNLPDTFHIYYKIADGKAECCLLSEITTEILNKKIGVTLSTDYLSLVIQNINNVFLGTSSADRFNISDFLDRFHPVCKNNTMVGISLNELTGCRMVYSLPNDKIDVPSDLVNNIYNIFENYTINVNPLVPDWINVACIDNATALDYVSYNTSSYQTVLDILNGTDDIVFLLNCNGVTYDNGGKLRGKGSWDRYLKFAPSDNYFFTVVNSGDLNYYIHDYDLTFEDNTIELDELLTENHQIGARIKDISTGYDYYINEYNLSGSNVGSYETFGICYYKCIPYKSDGGYITIYSGSNIPTRIENNTYSNSYYTSTTYNNFNTNNDNSYQTTVQNVNNSSTTNTNIYNQAKTTTNNNTTTNNFTYNTTQNQTDVTYIINYYYPDDSGDDGGDDDDDDSIWDALLKALGNFLKKIGELIGVILTGIIEICTSVLDAIASITESFTGVTDFIAAIFGFLPSELVSVLTLGITLAVLISLIKMFRG